MRPARDMERLVRLCLSRSGAAVPSLASSGSVGRALLCEAMHGLVLRSAALLCFARPAWLGVQGSFWLGSAHLVMVGYGSAVRSACFCKAGAARRRSVRHYQSGHSHSL